MYLMVSIIVFMVAFVVSICFYFIPAYIAKIRQHHNFLAILVLNIFLGWTFLGWVIACIWACTRVNKT